MFESNLPSGFSSFRVYFLVCSTNVVGASIFIVDTLWQLCYLPFNHNKLLKSSKKMEEKRNVLIERAEHKECIAAENQFSRSKRHFQNSQAQWNWNAKVFCNFAVWFLVEQQMHVSIVLIVFEVHAFEGSKYISSGQHIKVIKRKQSKQKHSFRASKTFFTCDWKSFDAVCLLRIMRT